MNTTGSCCGSAGGVVFYRLHTLSVIEYSVHLLWLLHFEPSSERNSEATVLALSDACSACNTRSEMRLNVLLLAARS